MITDIKQKLTELVKSVTGFTDERIYLSYEENYDYETADFASILSHEERIKKVMTKDNYRKSAGEIVTITKKYERTLPVVVAFSGINEETATGWLDEFLERLDSYIYIEKDDRKIAVELIPVSVAYSDSDTRQADFYICYVYIECVFGSYMKDKSGVLSEIKLTGVNYGK